MGMSICSLILVFFLNMRPKWPEHEEDEEPKKAVISPQNKKAGLPEVEGNANTKEETLDDENLAVKTEKKTVTFKVEKKNSF
jgi:hypothetical protein